MFGFKVVDGKPPLRFAGDENEYVELLKILNVPENAITTETNAIVMSRTEGKWDFASTTEPV